MFAAKNELFTRPSGYNISRSVRLRSSATAYFSRTPASAGNRKTWTWSGWVKRGTFGSNQAFFHCGTTSTTGNFGNFGFNSSNQFDLEVWAGAVFTTNMVFRDPSAWYHIVLAVDTTQATASNRVKLYVNGVQVTSFASDAISTYYTLNYDTAFNQALQHSISGRQPYSSDNYFDGYLTEINFIDGQALTPSSFGETDAVTGVWKAKKYSGTYGTNGFYLNFSDNSSNTSTTIGKDYSGNGNNWTPNNISVTSGITYDSMLDTPTPYADGGNGRGNYCVLNPIDPTGTTANISQANLYYNNASSSHTGCKANFVLPSSGKWYWEITIGSNTGSSPTSLIAIGVANPSASANSNAASGQYAMQYYTTHTIYSSTSVILNTGGTSTANTVCSVAYDANTGKIWFGEANVFATNAALTGGDPANGTSPCLTLSAGDYIPFVECYANSAYANFGQRPFTYTPPSGYVALNTQNLPTPTISNGATVMAATTYTGNSSTQSISNAVNGVSFKPDFVWIKNRTNALAHYLNDSVRGAYQTLFSNLTNAEYNGTSNSDGVSTFNSNGFTLLNGTNVSNFNQSANNYVGWQWQAGQGSTSSNTSGSITSTVSVNATAGFSVVTYTGTGANATVGHGLGVAPSMIIVKRRDAVAAWDVYHASIGATGRLYLNTTDATNTSSAPWNNTAPTSSVFTVGTATDTNASSSTIVAYCFSAVAGYSAFGSYTGNGSSDGPFVFTGFRPRWVMIKRTDVANDWFIIDTSRNTYNVAGSALYPNSSSSETTNGFYDLDIVSNGFKVRATNAVANASGGTYIYAAFAENPFKLALAR